MFSKRDLIATELDFQRLAKLCNEWGEFAQSINLKLSKAKLVDSFNVPRDVVTMNSRVRLADEASRNEIKVTLMYPQAVDGGLGQVSILTGNGISLYGARVGETIPWKKGEEITTVKVRAIDYQPEAAADWHL